MAAWLPAAFSSKGCVQEAAGMRAGGRWDALTDLRSERQLESETSLTEAAIATPLASSLISMVLDLGRIVTPVA